MNHPQFSQEDIAQRFTYHPPKTGQPEIYEDIRFRAHSLAETMCVSAPHSRELALALTHLEDAVMWCNAAIARHGE